ncbi:UbiA prenyltransferase family-domain-containing protein [Xylaria sp. CBS 124048]|nr:UbiA prenyltransferase family-domain-containing protein [Xylaria sp. CBS 124048]
MQMPPRNPAAMLSQRSFRPLRQIASYVDITWGFIESDMFTFAIPNTAFGIFGAFASLLLVDNDVSSLGPSAIEILSRLPYVLAFNVGNLLIFDLANQRGPQSIEEDRINKPWRPIPQGKITADQTRRFMLASIPVVLALSYAVGAWQQCVLISILSWMYNDLGGGDEAVVREVIISIAYGLFNSGSLLAAVGPGSSLNNLGLGWTSIVSGVILTTMQVQDLKDQEGDKLRNRKTIALCFGERFSRTWIAFFVCFWSWVCGNFWNAGPVVFGLNAALAVVIAARVLFLSTKKADARTWRMWCFWHASLYTLPLVVAGAAPWRL